MTEAEPPPAADPPELVVEYESAFKLLLTEQWDAGAKAFASIAARSVVMERRAAASALARFGHEMDERSDDGPKRTSGRASFVATTTLASFYTGFATTSSRSPTSRRRPSSSPA